MAIINPDHLIEQAETLIAPPAAGPPRQVDLRRAISASYYAVFHTLAAAVADRYVGTRRRATAEYRLAYRSLQHTKLKDLCVELRKPTPKPIYRDYVPAKGMSPFFAQFASAVKDLQEQRHMADYDPMARLRTSNAQAAIKTARSAMRRFSTMSKNSRDAFLSLLVFQVRQ